MDQTLEKIQKTVDAWIQQNGGYWSPLGMLAAVMEELGELSREISHLSRIKPKKPEEIPTSLELELGDLVYSIVCIANYYGISLTDAINQSIDKYQKRDSKRFIEKEMRNP
jgi:NTP pyrophosphatase (non-canonical NTP hydrolase)